MKGNLIRPLYPLKVFLGIIGYLGYFASAAVFLCVGMPFFMFLALWPALVRRLMYSVLKTYAFFLTRIWLPGLRVYSMAELPGAATAAVRGSVVVANHRSRLDALMLLSILPESGVVIKSKYAGTPPFSTFVKHLDFISIDPDSLQSLGAAVEKCRHVLGTGKNLLVFPEGTRARTGKLLPFGPFAFKVAIETNAPVVPVLVHSDLPLMARCKGSIFPKRKFSYTVRFLLPCRSEPGERPGEFAQRVRRNMAAELALLDKRTFWDTGAETV